MLCASIKEEDRKVVSDELYISYLGIPMGHLGVESMGAGIGVEYVLRVK